MGLSALTWEDDEGDELWGAERRGPKVGIIGSVEQRYYMLIDAVNCGLEWHRAVERGEVEGLRFASEDLRWRFCA